MVFCLPFYITYCYERWTVHWLYDLKPYNCISYHQEKSHTFWGKTWLNLFQTMDAGLWMLLLLIIYTESCQELRGTKYDTILCEQILLCISYRWPLNCALFCTYATILCILFVWSQIRFKVHTLISSTHLQEIKS